MITAAEARKLKEESEKQTEIEKLIRYRAEGGYTSMAHFMKKESAEMLKELWYTVTNRGGSAPAEKESQIQEWKNAESRRKIAEFDAEMRMLNSKNKGS